jgi:outer membrane protein insertion porin family
MMPRVQHLAAALLVAGFFGTCGRAAAGEATGPAGAAPTIRRVTIAGSKRTRDRVILREMRLRPGRPVAAGAESEDERRLLDLRLFSDVDVRADSCGPDSVDIVVNVRERLTLFPAPAFSYSAETGLSYGASLEEANFLGDGQRLAALAVFGARRDLSVSWSAPWLGYRHVGFSMGAFDSRWEDRVEALTERRRGVRAAASRYFSGYRYSVSCEGRVEDVRSDPTAGADSADAARHDSNRSLAIGAGYDTRDSRVNPRRGIVAGGVFEQVGSWLGGDVTLNRTSAFLSAFTPFALGTTLGVGTHGVFTKGSMPDYERVRLGGIRTVRGFAEGRASGESRCWMSLELRFPLARKRTFRLPVLNNFDVEVAGALFGDVGAVWDGENTAAARVLHGGGGGVMLFMPLAGVARSDLAVGSEGDWVLRGDGQMKF